jgi:hypothetical protein
MWIWQPFITRHATLKRRAKRSEPAWLFSDRREMVVSPAIDAIAVVVKVPARDGPTRAALEATSTCAALLRARPSSGAAAKRSAYGRKCRTETREPPHIRRSTPSRLRWPPSDTNVSGRPNWRRRACYARLAPFSGVFIATFKDHALGVAAICVNDRSKAVAHLTTAEAQARRAGARAELALILLRRGQLEHNPVVVTEVLRPCDQLGM